MKFNKSTDPVTEISDEEFNLIEKEVPKLEKVESKQKIFATPTIGVNARSNPDTKSSSLGVIYPGTQYEVEDFDREWYKLVSGDKKGAYVRKEYMK